jgi:diguanylate cyclase (GGDEF)-like protein
MHWLLIRQMQECFSSTETLSESARNFIAAVDGAYQDFETQLKQSPAKTRHIEQLQEANRQLACELSQTRDAEDQLLRDAFRDAMTGLPNRDLLCDRLDRCMARKLRNKNYQFAVLMLDLDRFKVVNDGLGHAVGDQLLVALARRLSECLRPMDTLARLGGDEFAILLEDIRDLSDATEVADRIHERLTSAFSLNGQEIYATTSIGIALNNAGYDRPQDVLRDADTAMYRAKALGKARYAVFDSSMREHAMSQLQIENDLRRAIEHNELSVHYQPIVALDTGKIHAMEALVRWEHPQRGMMEPAQFITVAEETGLIRQIDRLVLNQACRQMQQWQQSFPRYRELRVNVNLSSRQFTQGNLVEQIQQILQQSKLEGRWLTLEITESLIVENAQLAADMLQRLRQQDIQIHIDDFGTGYSSLSYLHNFPIDDLKIDRSFVSRLGLDTDNSQIVRSVVMLAHSLGIHVTAEGIETARQLKCLRDLGCEYGQGYYFSNPLPPAMATELLQTTPAWPASLLISA